MRPQLSDNAIHELGQRFDIQVREEAAYILWYIWRDMEKQYSSLQACLETLAVDDELYSALVSCQAIGAYGRIREWTSEYLLVTLLSFDLIIYLARKKSDKTDDCKVEQGVAAFLAEIQPSMDKLVRGDISLPTWVPICDSTHAEHLASLKIPALKGKPNLLLHDLGRFTAEDVLSRRLQNIFMPNNHTSVYRVIPLCAS